MLYHNRWVILLLLFIPAGRSLFRRVRDPLEFFCGKEDCYEVLNVTRNATKGEIKQSYRALSRVNHPDKGGDAQAFAQISKAYSVFTNDTKREEYDFYVLDYPDAYSSKFGHRLLYSYSPQSNLILVLVGILVFISVCVVANQHNNHTNAVSFIRIAAENNLSASRGGWPVSVLVRKMAEERINQVSPASNHNQRNGSISGRKGKQKKLRPIKMSPEMQLAIRRCSEEVELVGEFAAVSWKHVPILHCYRWPVNIFSYASYFFRWTLWRLYGGGHEKAEVKTPLSDEDNEYWICRLIGKEIWETISEEMQKEAIVCQVWRDEEKMIAWKKRVGLTGNGIIRMKPQDKGLTAALTHIILGDRDPVLIFWHNTYY